MKVLILSTYGHSGGAAIAASRLLTALKRNGIEATMMCRRNLSWWKGKPQSWTSIIERGLIWLANGLSMQYLWDSDWALLGQDITKTKEYREADVVHLHYVEQGFISLSCLEKMKEDGKKIVWTMHDAWNSTGVCHLTLGCEEFRKECRNCKYTANWAAHLNWKRKRTLYDKSNITFVTCSEWLRNEALSSGLMKDCNVISIPNAIDSSIYYQTSKEESRKKLGLDKDRKMLLFIAQSVSNPYKGMNYLASAMKELKDKSIELIMLGSSNEDITALFEGTKVHCLGYVNDAETIRDAYNAADAFVLPSLSENLPNTIMEAMSCGTPCVGFNIGGIPEMIDHEKNGYVAKYKDHADLAKGISFVLEKQSELSKISIRKVLENYAEDVIAKRHIEIYRCN